MPTHLEMVFDFTADDLVANKQGKLSADQQTDQLEEVISMRRLVRMYTLLQLGFPFIIVLRVFFHLIFDYEDIEDTILAFAGISIFMISSTHFQARKPRKRLHFLRHAELLRSPVVTKEAFQPKVADMCGTCEFQTEHLNITLSLRQYDALQEKTDYQVYCWANGNETPSDILSVEQLDGTIVPCTPVELSFKFSAEDLDANKNGAFTLHQVCEHYDDHSLPTDYYITAIILCAFFAIIPIMAISSGDIFIGICGSLGPLLGLVSGGYLFWSIFQARQIQRDILDTGQPSVAAGLRQVDFTGGESYRMQIYWFDDEDGMRFELSVAQWNALHEDASYVFYFLPLSDSEEGHTILSVERQELS